VIDFFAGPLSEAGMVEFTASASSISHNERDIVAMDLYRLNRATVLSLVILFQGCGGGAGTEGRQKVYPVTGKVTFSGGPVVNALVSFSPKGQQPVAVGRTDDSGVYQLTTYDRNDGAAEGDYTVLVSKSSSSADTAPPAHGVNVTTPHQHTSGRKAKKASDEAMLPVKYTDVGKSGLTFTVKAEGENHYDIDLKP
jgi:hypothetical protein